MRTEFWGGNRECAGAGRGCSKVRRGVVSAEGLLSRHPRTRSPYMSCSEPGSLWCKSSKDDGITLRITAEALTLGRQRNYCSHVTLFSDVLCRETTGKLFSSKSSDHK